MADSFFGFNTSLNDTLDNLHENEFEDDEEDEYDALNDETFGPDCLEGDWEEDHEKLAEITEQNRIHNNSYNEEDDDNLDLENSISQFVLDDCDDEEDLTVKKSKTVCTVEEIERNLFSQQKSCAQPVPSPLRVEDLERDLALAFQHGRREQQQTQNTFNHQKDAVVNQNQQNVCFIQNHPMLGVSSGIPNSVVVPVGLRPMPMQDLRHLNPQAPRIVGSAPNMMRFIPPHLIIPQGGHIQDHNSLLGHPPFSNNGLIKPMMQQRNMGYRVRYQGHHPAIGQPLIAYNRTYQNARNNHNHFQGDGLLGEYDEYAGLMTEREKQWLQNIQLMQLATDTPHIDDYYYSVFSSRKRNNKSKGDCNEIFNHRIRRDSHRDKEKSDHQKTYTPTQFENSLGKLQVGSVTAPRKIIDMDIVSTENVESSVHSSQKDSRRAKQVLLEIERLYSILLVIEDLKNPLIDTNDAEEDVEDLLLKIVGSLLNEDWLPNIMCIHKGKLLVLRILPFLMESSQFDNYLLDIWSIILKTVVNISRRDAGSEAVLPRFYLIFKDWLHKPPFSSVLHLTNIFLSKDFIKTNMSAIEKNSLAHILGNKFAISVLVAMIDHAESKFCMLEEEQCSSWLSFMDNIIEGVGLISSVDALPSPYKSIDSEVLNSHLSRCSGIHITKYPSLLRALTGLPHSSIKKSDTVS